MKSLIIAIISLLSVSLSLKKSSAFSVSPCSVHTRSFPFNTCTCTGKSHSLHRLVTDSGTTLAGSTASSKSGLFSQKDDNGSSNELSVMLDAQLTDERTKSLFAWICRAFVGDEEYNNLMLAMAAIFGTNLPQNSLPLQLVDKGEWVSE